LWGGRWSKRRTFEDAVRQWLAYPGPALLDAVTSRFELVMPPNIAPSMVFGTALYSVKAVLSGRGKDVVELVEDNFLKIGVA
jgi:pyruvate dehydrogenase (quinone)